MSLFEELRRRNVIRVAIAYVLLGWAVLQGADFLLDLVEAPKWVIRVFAIAGLVGFPFALFFAWAFELTPEGVKREKDVDRSQSITPRTGKKLDRVIIGLLILVIVLMAVERVWFAGSASPEAGVDVAEAPKTIAVLPFADLSQAQDQGWFADGLAEEILNALVRVPDLWVAARTSSFAFKGSNADISEIADQLGVAHVLEGSVRSSGDRIRVTAQLIRASDGFHLWSQNFDRDVADMIGIQEDLARNIATALETTMDPEALAQMAQAGTDSVEAYQEYLRGLQKVADDLLAGNSSGQGTAVREAYEHFERARAIDPDFFDAHVQAAAYWKVQLTPSRTDSGTSGLAPSQMLKAYNERIGRAIESARSEADRIRSLADRAMVDLRLRESRRLFDEYLALRPNDELARFELAGVLGMLSEREGFRAILDYWKERGQSDLAVANNYANEAYRVIDPSEAADVVLKFVERWPNSDALLYQAHRTMVWAGRFSEASKLAARYETLVPGGDELVRAREACAAGDRAAAERILETLDGRNDDLSVRWLLHNMLGNARQEIEVLRPLEQSGVLFQLASYLIYAKFDPRPYPSLMAVLEREGIERPPPTVPPFRCPPPSQPSVAVLPFVNMSADPDNEYFSEGVAEEILNVLARVPELKVTARTSSFSYKGSEATIARIARELGVNHVLEGSVRKAGNQVRVTAQLIEAGKDFHLWSETYDRELNDIFAIQDEIAGAIAEALKVRLLPAREQPNLTGTTNLEAYQLFLKGVNLWHLRTGESLEQALQLFEQAIERDPSFARAHAYRALTWGILSDYSDRALSQTRPAAQAAAEAAVALDPESIEAATALIEPLLADSPAVLEALVERGRDLIAGNPGFATTYQWHATNLFNSGRVEEALAAYRAALELDPRSRIVHQNLAMLLLVRGQFDEAAVLLDNLEEFAPDYWDGALTRFLLYLFSGRRDDAEVEGNRLVEIMGRTNNTVPPYLDLYFAPERRAAAAAEILTFPRDRWWDPDNPSLVDEYALPLLLAAAGAHDEALYALRRSLQERGPDFYRARLVSASTLTGGFSCRPDVQAFYAELGLPPSAEAPPCSDL